jgi:hypothetical protein
VDAATPRSLSSILPFMSRPSLHSVSQVGPKVVELALTAFSRIDGVM